MLLVYQLTMVQLFLRGRCVCWAAVSVEGGPLWSAAGLTTCMPSVAMHQDLHVGAKKDGRVLLNGVSGLVRGGLCAVMVSW